MKPSIKTLKKIAGHPFKIEDIFMMYEQNFKNEENDNLIKKEYDNYDNFLDEVNDDICQKFDASLGLNWDDINDSIEYVLEDLKD